MAAERQRMAWATTLFAIDTRGLAAFRICLGLLLLYDLWLVRSRNLVGHYSDNGVLPLAAVPGPSFHVLNGHPAFILACFLLATGFAVFLVVGYHTWFATAVSWLLLASLQMRNPWVNNAGDQLLAFLLFWGLFLPLGARASVDQRCHVGTPVRERVVSAASLALLVQVVMVYFFAALSKDAQAWWRDRWAIEAALHWDLYVKPMGRSLLQFPDLLRYASASVYVLEWCAPLALLPFQVWRFLAAAVFVTFHGVLQLCFHLDLFALAGMTAWCVFLPSWFWDGLLARRPMRKLQRPWNWTLDRWAARIGRASSRRPWLAAPVPSQKAPLWASALALSLLLYVLVWNLDSLNQPRRLPQSIRWFGQQFYLAQTWRVFAPAPSLADAWWVAEARLRNGRHLDLLTRAPVDWRPPSRPAGRLTTPRWRKYFENLSSPAHRSQAENFCAWLRYDWQAGRDASQDIASLRLYRMLRQTQPGARGPVTEAVPVKQLIYEWPETTSDHNAAASSQDILRLHLAERWRIGGLSNDPGELFGSIGTLCVSSAGQTYLVDNQQNEVKIFSPTGEFVGNLGQYGEAPGEHLNPYEVFELPGGDICVRQLRPMAFNVYDAEFHEYREQLKFEVVTQDGARSITASQSRGGTIVLKANFLLNRPEALVKTWKILTVRRDGTTQDEIAGHERAYRKARRVFHEIDAHKNRFKIGPSGLVYLVPGYDYRIEVYEPDGELIRVVMRPYEPVRRSKEAIESLRKLYGPSWAEVKISEQRFDIKYFLIDASEHLWVLSSRGTGTQDESLGIYDVFAPTGQFKGRFELVGTDARPSSLLAINEWGIFVLGYGAGTLVEEPESVTCYELPSFRLD